MRLILALLCATATVALVPAASHAEGCTGGATLQQVGEICAISGHDAATIASSGDGGDRINYTFKPNCHEGTRVCSETPTCTAEDGGEGEDLLVYEGSAKVGETCWTGKAADPQLPTPDRVMAAARRLSWPAATLIIQPPDGETLVNFATNFYTTTTQHQIRTVSLLGVRVTIDAAPAAYTWLFGDGERQTGSDPGAAYPAMGVEHRYRTRGTVSAQVDVTYRGRYRFGTGPWQPLPDTLAVPGTARQLRVRTATPLLVGG